MGDAPSVMAIYKREMYLKKSMQAWVESRNDSVRWNQLWDKRDKRIPNEAR